MIQPANSTPSRQRDRSWSGPGRPSLLGALSALVLLIAGCTSAGIAPSPGRSASPGGSPSPSGGSDGPVGPGGGSSIAHPGGPHDLVIRYEEIGGFVAPEALVTRYPVVSIYGDGTTITEGPVPAIYPGMALPNLQAAKISEAGLQTLLSLADSAGLLGPDASYDATGIADATTARFTVVARGATHLIGAYALGASPDDAALVPAVAAARAKLRAFVAAVDDVHVTLGAEAGPGAAYVYDGIRLYVTRGSPVPSDPSLAREPIAWPLSTPLATFGAPGTGTMSGARCGALSGADLEKLRPLLATATQITGWSSGGSTFTVLPLPLLPDQTGCPAAT
jgi:hypothetical protein